MPIVIRFDRAAPLLQSAINAGQFATDRTLTAENLRERAFQEDSARSQASFALGGQNQGFAQRQQLNDQAFRQQQAQISNGFQQQGLDQQAQYRQDSLDARLAQTQLQNEGRLGVADLNQQGRLQGIGMQQQGMDQRNDEDNQVKLLLQQNNIDWRTADRQTVDQARQHLQQMRGQQGQDLEQLRFQNRGALQDDQQEFLGGQNQLNRDQRQGQFDQRLNQTQTQFEQRMLNQVDPQARERMIRANQYMTRIENAHDALVKDYPQQFDKLTREPIPRPAHIQKQIDDFRIQHQSLRDQLEQAMNAVPGQGPTVQDVYRQYQVNDLQPGADGTFGAAVPPDPFVPVTSLDPQTQTSTGSVVQGPDGHMYQTTGRMGPDGTPEVVRIP